MRFGSMLVLGSLAVVGCRGGGGGGGHNPDSTGSGGGQTIYDVQNDMMAPGTPVSLHGVIVTAIDNFGMKTGDIWVQEAMGGPFSGVHVFGVPTTTVAGLALGDVVDLSGAVKDEFALSTDTSGRTVTELKAATGGMITVTKTGSGSVPAPQVVDALAIGMMPDQASRDKEWEKWEGVLIQVNNVSVTNKPACVGSSCTDPTMWKFNITGGVVVESSLAAFPMDGMMNVTINRGDCLGSVVGVEDYFFDYLILPRQTTEIMTAANASACPAPENTPALCSDTLDNDGNGFADCNDISCMIASPSCRMTSTIEGIQTATTLPTGALEVDNVFVTAISFNKKNLWVSDSLTSTAQKGIYVPYNTLLDAQITVGSKVTVIGKAQDFNNDTMGDSLRELNGYSVTFGTAAAGQPVPISGVTAATLKADHKHDGELVTLTNVKIKTVGDAMFHVGTFTQGTTDFLFDDDIFRIPNTDAAGTCYSTITGIWQYQVFNNDYVLLPIAAGTPGAGC